MIYDFGMNYHENWNGAGNRQFSAKIQIEMKENIFKKENILLQRKTFKPSQISHLLSYSPPQNYVVKKQKTGYFLDYSLQSSPTRKDRKQFHFPFLAGNDYIFAFFIFQVAHSVYELLFNMNAFEILQGKITSTPNLFKN